MSTRNECRRAQNPEIKDEETIIELDTNKMKFILLLHTSFATYKCRIG